MNLNRKGTKCAKIITFTEYWILAISVLNFASFASWQLVSHFPSLGSVTRPRLVTFSSFNCPITSTTSP